MKQWLWAVVLAMTATFCFPAYGQQIDCESMLDLSNGLSDIEAGLSDGEDVDDETYGDLADIIDSLHEIAAAEGERNLERALRRLDRAHSSNDREGFVAALSEVVDLFDALYERDC